MQILYHLRYSFQPFREDDSDFEISGTIFNAFEKVMLILDISDTDFNVFEKVMQVLSIPDAAFNVWALDPWDPDQVKDTPEFRHLGFRVWVCFGPWTLGIYD